MLPHKVMSHRLAIGLVLIGAASQFLAVLVLFIVAMHDGDRLAMALASAVSALGVFLLIIERWLAVPVLASGRRHTWWRRQTLRSMFLWPAAAFLFSVGMAVTACVILAVCALNGVVYGVCLRVRMARYYQERRRCDHAAARAVAARATTGKR